MQFLIKFLHLTNSMFNRAWAARNNNRKVNFFSYRLSVPLHQIKLKKIELSIYKFRQKTSVLITLKSYDNQSHELQSCMINKKKVNQLILDQFLYSKNFFAKLYESNQYLLFQQNIFLFLNLKSNNLSLIKVRYFFMPNKKNIKKKTIHLYKRFLFNLTFPEKQVTILPKNVIFTEQHELSQINYERLKTKKICIFRRSRNNTFLTLTNGLGNVIFRTSAGLAKIKTARRRRSQETLEIVCLEMASYCYNHNIAYIDKLLLNSKNVAISVFYKLKKIFNSIGLHLKINPRKETEKQKPDLFNKNRRQRFKKKKQLYEKIRIGFQFVCYNINRSHNGIRSRKLQRK